MRGVAEEEENCRIEDHHMTVAGRGTELEGEP